MRIAHVLSSLAMGGQERVALDLAAAQVRRGHHVCAVSLAPLPHGALAEQFIARDIGEGLEEFLRWAQAEGQLPQGSGEIF